MRFRKKIYNSLEELQVDVIEWLHKYNAFRPHSGRYCHGKTPMQTFLDSNHIVIDKSCGTLLGKSDSSSNLTKTVS